MKHQSMCGEVGGGGGLRNHAESKGQVVEVLAPWGGLQKRQRRGSGLARVMVSRRPQAQLAP